MIQDKIRELVQYGLLTGLVSAEDEIYTTNRLLELFQIEDYPYGFGEKIEQTEEEAVKRLPDLLTEMMDYAVENGIMTAINGKLEPNANAGRGDVAMMLMAFGKKYM